MHTAHQRRTGAVGAIAALALGASAVAAAAPGAAAVAPARHAAAASAQITVLTPYAAIGQTVRWTAKGLPPSQTLDVVWETAQGTWKINGQTLIGDTYTFGQSILGTLKSTASGTAAGSFVVPAGFGGVHNFGLTLTSGTPEASSSVTVTMTARISSTTEPDGGFFTLHVQGLGYGGGYNAYDAEYGILYDDHYMGFISGVTTEGAATFQVRAEGVGAHEISIINSPVEGPYLNQQQSPYPWFPQFDWKVDVTQAVPTTRTAAVPVDTAPAVGDHLTVTPGAGYVGGALTLTGSGLPKSSALAIEWQTQLGNRVTSGLWSSTALDLGTVRTSAEGAFSATLKVPSTLGGPPHVIDLVDNGKVVGHSQFQIFPRLVGVTPAVVRQGQPFTVHLTGVGWTQYDNIYAVDYDDAYVGYGCGFNSQGDVQVVLRAAGAPGYHFIDLYPSPYQGGAPVPNWYGMPQLTYASDHPGEKLPAFHVVIRVVK